MGYHLDQLIRCRDWALAGGDEIWAFHMGSWISGGPVSVLHRHPQSACLAGGVVLMNGAYPIWTPVQHRPGGVQALEVRNHGVIWSVPALAAAFLGVSDPEAEMLFDPDEECFTSPKETALLFLDALIVRAEQGLGNLDEDDVEEWVGENTDVVHDRHVDGYDSDAYYFR